MNGAQALVRTAIRAGIEICFANAGTTEVPILTSLDSEPGIRSVLGLFEGVCTGAADGYGRLSDKPAMTLLHLGPGFANGIANLHNARRARTPLLNIIGEHATWHQHADPPLAMNIEALTGSVSGWHRRNASTETLSRDTVDAISACGYGQIASLIVPNDYQLAECGIQTTDIPKIEFDLVYNAEIEKAATHLLAGKKTAIIVGGRGLRKRGLTALARIQAKTGCALLVNSFPGYMERGAGYPDIIRMPYFPEPAIELLSGFDSFILAGSPEPVTFFGYHGIRSFLIKEDQIKLSIGTGNQYIPDVLEELAAALHAPAAGEIPRGILAAEYRPAVPAGQLTPENICATIAALIPEDAIIVDEGLTTSIPFYPMTKGLPPHSYMTIAGGSIGYGMPCATGAALACPGRPVINIQADGSAAYTMQSLWTQAREKLNVITLICSNRGYNIIRVELARAGIASAGPNTLKLIDIDDPALNWVKIAEGMGVQAGAVSTAEELAFMFRRALLEPGPYLIEMAVKYLV